MKNLFALMCVLVFNTAGAQNYDPKTVVSIEGEIKTVQKISHEGGEGIHLIVQTDSGETTVHVGPGWYVEQQTVTLKEGDLVTVKGSLVTLSGKEVIIARTITKGAETMRLRERDGTPLWSGMKNRARRPSTN